MIFRQSLSNVQRGLLFEASAFGEIETIPLPSQVHIRCEKNAKLAVSVNEQVLTGQPLTQPQDQIVASHASLSGVVSAITNNTVTIQSDQLDTPFEGEKPPLNQSGDYQAFFRTMGLVGLGGAGFPVSKKLASVKPSILLINAAECDPAIYCDEALMQERAADTISGIEIARTATQAEQCIIGIEDNKPDAIAQLKALLPDHIQLVIVPAVYPSGAERTLLNLCTGLSGSLNSNNAICFNVATCYAMHQAVNHTTPLISRIVTVVTPNKTHNFELRIGTPLEHLHKLLGTSASNTLRCGGQMMGWQVASDHCVDKRTNSIIFDGIVLRSTENQQALPCIRCGACEKVCPENLLPQQLFWHTTPHNTQALGDLKLNQCIECGCCDAVCPSHIPLAASFTQAKQHIHIENIEQRKATLAKHRFEKRLARESKNATRQRKELDKKTALLNTADQKKPDQINSEDAKKAMIAKALQRKKNKKSSAPAKNPDQKNASLDDSGRESK